MRLLSSTFLFVAAVAQAAEPVFVQHASWSRDSRSLLVSARADNHWNVYEIRLSDGRTRKLPFGDDAMYAVWSPDGKRIAYASGKDIYVATPDGMMISRLTTDPAADTYPTWSPDGKSIAFNSERSGKAQVWTMNADGSNQRRLFTSDGNDYNPVWGPELLYESDRHGEKDELYLGERRVTQNDVHDIFPTWTSDGRLLWAGDRAIVTMRPDGSDRRELVKDAFFGVMSPDRKWLAFIRGRWPASRLFLARAGGTSPRALFPK